MKQGTELATEYAGYYKLDPQAEGESDMTFRGRVSGWLRDQGEIILAHEAYQNERYEESGDVMTGLTGAIAQALQGVDYGSRGERQIGDDFAAGIVASKRPDDANAILLALLFGSRR